MAAVRPVVVVADDDALFCSLCQLTLAAFNCEVVCMADGGSTMDYLDQHPPAVLLLDMLLPIVAGETVLEWLYSDARFQQTYVIVISADARFRKLSMRKGDHFMMKPVMPTQIRNAVSHLLALSDQ